MWFLANDPLCLSILVLRIAENEGMLLSYLMSRRALTNYFLTNYFHGDDNCLFMYLYGQVLDWVRLSKNGKKGIN